jgi:hypothetical protein
MAALSKSRARASTRPCVADLSALKQPEDTALSITGVDGGGTTALNRANWLGTKAKWPQARSLTAGDWNEDTPRSYAMDDFDTFVGLSSSIGFCNEGKAEGSAEGELWP